MAIKVKNGVATIDTVGLGGTFIGATAEGKFPPVGHEYSSFSFEPKRGESGVIVLSDQVMRRSCGFGADYLHLYGFEWIGDKLVVHHNIENPVRAFTESNDLGLIVQARDWYYITGSVADHDHNYKVVDLFSMLKYIEGKIGLKELDHNARSYERRQVHIRRMKELEQALQNAQWNLESSQRTVDKVIDLNRGALHEMELQVKARMSLQDQIKQVGGEVKWMRSLPRWLVPRGVRVLFEIHDNL